jgi:hypothetical protein
MHNTLNFMTKKGTIIFIVVILSILILFLISPYYLIRNDIPLNNETLSSIGSYISGGVSILNLFVFVYLTILVARYEDAKSKNEVQAQKKIVQSQFRQTELNKFVIEIEKPFDTSLPSNLEQSILRFTAGHLAVNNFLNQNQYLFPILKDPEFFKFGKELAVHYAEMVGLLERNQQKIDQVKVESLFMTIVDKRHEFVHVLQAFMIEDLER